MKRMTDKEPASTSMKQCVGCRLVIPYTAKFCLECGASVPGSVNAPEFASLRESTIVGSRSIIIGLAAVLLVVFIIAGIVQQAPTTAQGVPVASVNQTAPKSAAGSVLTPEASEALTVINQRFVPSNCTPSEIYEICNRNEVLSISEGKLIMAEDFEEHRYGGAAEYSHSVQTVAANDLDLNSLEVIDNSYEGGTDEIHVNCKGNNKCVSSVSTSGKNGTQNFSNKRLSIGDFPRKDANDAGSYLKRLLAIQQGVPVPVIEHEPREEEAEAFITAHFAPTAEYGDGITAFNRSLRVQGDELVETDELMQYGNRPGHLSWRVNLKDLIEDLMVSDSRGVGLTCRFEGNSQPPCFFADTGQSSTDHVVIGVSDGERFMKMLKRLIVLHQ